MPSPNDLYRRLRRRLGLSQTQLGERLGLTGRQIQNLENGVTPIRQRDLLAVQALLPEKFMECELLSQDDDCIRLCVSSDWSPSQLADFLADFGIPPNALRASESPCPDYDGFTHITLRRTP